MSTGASSGLEHVLQEALEPHLFKGKMVAPSQAWDKAGRRRDVALRRNEHPMYEIAKLKYDRIKGNQDGKQQDSANVVSGLDRPQQLAP